MGEKPVAEYLCSHGQQARHEAVRVQESVDEGEGETEGRGPLDYSSVLQL